MRQLFEAGRLQVLARTRADEAALAECAATDYPEELESLRRRYRLQGNEDMTLLDAGVDSLDLVTMLHWIRDECRSRGSGDLADRITMRLFGSLTVKQVFDAGSALTGSVEIAPASLEHLIREAMRARLSREHEQMREDSVYHRPQHAVSSAASDADDVFLTGGTGFLGPFLLLNLLQQTDSRIHVLVRGQDLAHAAGRLRREFGDTIGALAPIAEFDARVVPVCGDLSRPKMGLQDSEWESLLTSVGTVYHNAALVNYLLDYQHLRDVNVGGTERIIDFTLSGAAKVLNYVSTTFVFGWATRDVLYEHDENIDMEHLDFGYSQSKWVAERLVSSAMQQGLQARIFRPALITPALDGRGTNLDIALRLLAFMIRHGVSVDTGNQVSFMPVDVAAANIVNIARQADSINRTFHVTRDGLETMPRVTEIIGQQTGIRFTSYALKEFVPEVIRRCTRDDVLFPLLDFLVESVDNIAAMEYKLYDNSCYREARDSSPSSLQDAPLEDVVAGIIAFLRRKHLLPGGLHD
jgi:thioester reductase-like protein